MILVGIDSGGTSCRAVVCDEHGFVLRKCKVPGHNPNADGFDALEESFRQVLAQALEPYGGLDAAPEAVFAGVAGGEGRNRAILEDILRRLLPRAKHLRVRSDALIALASGLGRHDGGVMIAGTGTVAFLRQGDSLRRFGGWGYLLDRGGAGWNIGRDGFLAAMAPEDAALPETALTLLYERHFGMKMADAIPALYAGELHIAPCAPLVFEAAAEGDAVAEGILRDNASLLARRLQDMVKAFGGPLTVVMAGGLLQGNSVYLSLVRELSADAHVTLLVPEHPPIFGAVCLAAELAGLPEDPAFAEHFSL